MVEQEGSPSARKTELLDAAYRYVLGHGLTDLSLRPLAAAIGSSPRVLLYLFGSKDELIKQILAVARADELAELDAIAVDDGLATTARSVWVWLADPGRRGLLAVWLDAYTRSVIDPDGPWGGFAADAVATWLAVLARAQPVAERRTSDGRARARACLTVLRGGIIDLLATGETARVTAAVHRALPDVDRP